MNTTAIDVTAHAPLDHGEAMNLLSVELDQTLDLLRSLSGPDWSAPTDCPDWDVRQMYLHVLGACEAGASMKENIHQMRAARSHRKAHGGPLEAGLSAVQVRERIDLSPSELIGRLETVALETVRKRTTMPALMRRMKMKIDGPVVETWTLGYLVDTIYLRDLWMHRIDTSMATGSEPMLTTSHDGAIVADVVAEWARRHGRPFTLMLGGPAGGTYTSDGADTAGYVAEPIEIDAVEYCRNLAGRGESAPLFDTIVPF